MDAWTQTRAFLDFFTFLSLFSCIRVLSGLQSHAFQYNQSCSFSCGPLESFVTNIVANAVAIQSFAKSIMTIPIQELSSESGVQTNTPRKSVFNAPLGKL